MSRRRGNLAKLAALNKPDELIPLGMRQSNGISILANCDAVVGDLYPGIRRSARIA